LHPVRTKSNKLAVALLATAVTAVGSWLLVADPSLGRMRNEKSAQAVKAKRGLRARSHGYGGYTGSCLPGTLRPLSAPESFIRRGRLRCFESSGNPTGDNPDLSHEAFFADHDGVLVNMTKDTRRCVEGSNNAAPCTTFQDCPGGRCEDMNTLACTSDARGRIIYLIFDGNPTGQNADLGDELFAFDVPGRQLTQLTNQRGWCSDSPAQLCDRNQDCSTGVCARARMSGTQRGYGGSVPSSSVGLEVSPEGNIVWFVTDGDPGGNPGHAVTQFLLTTRGQARGLRAISSAGKVCAAGSENAGKPCTSSVDCGTVCGDRRVDPGEECEPFVFPPTCPSGEFCRTPGFADECTCIGPVCGNGIIEQGELCEPTFGCSLPTVCNSTCTGCVFGSASGAFL
jgi:hypothetical protein